MCTIAGDFGRIGNKTGSQIDDVEVIKIKKTRKLSQESKINTAVCSNSKINKYVDED